MAAVNPETVRDFLIDGLKNAHAMESQAITLTTAQASRLEHYPHLEKRLREHLQETEGQRTRLETCLQELGTSHSTLKDLGLQASGAFMAMFHAAAPDEVIKNTLASYAFEHFEIAAYKALIEAAQLAGNASVEQACRQNLAEEERMASWIDENLPELVRKYVGRTSVGVESKH